MLLLWLRGENETISILRRAEGLAVRTEPHSCSASPPNGSDVKLRGQGPRGYGRAARRLPAFEARDAGGVTPFKYR